MKTLLKSSALAVALAAGAAMSAHAVPFVSGSLVVSALTSTTTDLAGTTAFTLVPASLTLQNGTQDFSAVPATVIADPSFDLGNLSSFNFTDPALGTFTAGSIIDQTFNAATHALSFIVLGNYSTGTDFDPGSFTADEAFSLTQVGGAGTGISISATFFSPQVLPPSVPEPVTISLFGAGLAALGLARRRRQ